jgi:hypothetical protein
VTSNSAELSLYEVPCGSTPVSDSESEPAFVPSSGMVVWLQAAAMNGNNSVVHLRCVMMFFP